MAYDKDKIGEKVKIQIEILQKENKQWKDDVELS